MRRFESIIMSKTEPVPDGTLWLKEKESTINNKDQEDNKPLGFDIWWFGPSGWQPLLDLDTRYKYTNQTLTDGVGEVPVVTEQTEFSNIGIVRVDNTYSIYDGSRALANNTNFVNETGLKKHVDNLQSQINTLSTKISALESKVTSLENNINNVISLLNTVNDTIDTLDSRISNLEASTQG